MSEYETQKKAIAEQLEVLTRHYRYNYFHYSCGRYHSHCMLVEARYSKGG